MDNTNPNQNPAPDPNAAPDPNVAPDPNAAPPADPNAGQDPNLPQGMTPSAPAQPATPAPQGQPKKSSAWLWILLIVLLLVVGGGAAYYFLVYAKKSTTEPTTTTSTTTTQKEETAEDYYTKAKEIEPTGEKAIAVNTELKPILETVFTDVKLNEESGLMLTYVVKREIVAADVTSVKTALEGAGYTAADSSEDQLTMTKGASTWVISFKVGDKEKATIDVTF